MNAFTSHEITSYWFKLPSEHIFAGLDILCDMLNNPKFEKEKFEKEKKVILEEIKMYHDDPKRAVFEQIEKNLFEKPFGELVIGNSKTVSSLNRDFVADYFDNMYNPENYIVTIVGNADFNEICDYLERKFQKKGRKMGGFNIKRRNGESIEERDGIDQAHFIFAMHAPLPSEKDSFDLEVLDAYLANGMSSRVFLEIREKRGLAYAVTSSIDCEKSYSFYTIYVGTMKDKVGEVKRLILEEFDNVKNMKEKDLEQAKERVIGLKKVVSEESINVMNQLVFSELSGKAEDYYEHEEKIREVKLENVKKLASKLIKEYSSAAIVPK